MFLLAINSGSSSIKVSVYSHGKSSKELQALQVVEVSSITSSRPKLKIESDSGDEKGKDISGIKSQQDAFHQVLDHLLGDDGPNVIKSKSDISIVVHRIVHGGEYASPKLVDEDTFEVLEDLSDLAPLHNTPALDIVREIPKCLSNAANFVVFDTAFHKSIPKHLYTYPIDAKIAQHNKLRRYGFHGISYKFLTQAVAYFLGKETPDVNIIALHLGSGSSACCIRNGESLDTSMGLTPTSGLPGATRSGNVDPSLIFHYTHNAGKPSSMSTKEMHLTTAEEILNKKSGWNALTGTTDFEEITTKAAQGDESSKLVFDLFVSHIVTYVADYFVKLNGVVDALVFAGGIGEHSGQLRQAVVSSVMCLGFKIDDDKNSDLDKGVVVDIGARAGASRTNILVCRTDEQLQMAKEVLKFKDDLKEAK